MIAKVFAWLKMQGYKQLIKQMDELEAPFALKIREAQKSLGAVPPEAFAKTVVDDIQRLLCSKLGVDPKELGL